jgi:tRNA pseudouridine38-40 synthase
MQRYFLEVVYRGEGLSGFQIQDNAPTVQSAIEEVFQIYFKKKIPLTGSSRTDAGVHAKQNYFHFDWDGSWEGTRIYNLNALLPDNIAIRSIRPVREGAHARFDAIARSYEYLVYQKKDPFLRQSGWYFPYEIDASLLQRLADMIRAQENFEAFSKRNTQVKHFRCAISESYWKQDGYCLCYYVTGNRFLRGMVRSLVSTMLQVARGNKTEPWFYDLFKENSNKHADFSAPAKGLALVKVDYPVSLFL